MVCDDAWLAAAASDHASQSLSPSSLLYRLRVVCEWAKALPRRHQGTTSHSVDCVSSCLCAYVAVGEFNGEPPQKEKSLNRLQGSLNYNRPRGSGGRPLPPESNYSQINERTIQ